MSKNIWGERKDEILILLKTKTVTQIAEHFNVKRETLRKACIRMEIPLPSRKYTPRVAENKPDDLPKWLIDKRAEFLGRAKI